MCYIEIASRPTMLAAVNIGVILVVLVVLNLIGMTIAAWCIMRRK
jgi:hypothetical protein